MLIFPTLARPARSLAISSTIGPINRHGPHQGAQKSSKTGTSDFATSSSKLVSVIVSVFAPAINRRDVLLTAAGGAKCQICRGQCDQRQNQRRDRHPVDCCVIARGDGH